jgi:hypothetical protein
MEVWTLQGTARRGTEQEHKIATKNKQKIKKKRDKVG